MWSNISAHVSTALASDGIAYLPKLLPAERCAALLAAVAWARATPSPAHRCLSPTGLPRLESDLFRWRDVPEIRALVTDPALVEPGRAVLGTDDPVVLEDQWFWSEAGAATPSPWHQDEPYHPLDRPFLTIWIPLTPVPPGLGLRGVAGSHLGAIYPPIEFSAQQQTLASGPAAAAAPVPDVDADPAGFRVIEPPAEPGDVVLLDSRTLHAAGGQCPEDFVRLSIRYTHPETARRNRSWPTATFWDEFSWAPGERLPAQAFPRASALAGAV
jgi:hypothetical protein